jgi:hypothetical protein
MARFGDSRSPADVFAHRIKAYPKSPKYGWRDITSNVIVRGSGPADPSWTQISSSAIWAYQFDLNDQCWFTFHIPHDIVPGASIHFHSHWMADGTNTQSVKWEWDYVYALGFDQEAFAIGSETNVTAESTPSGTAYQHNVTETAAITIATLTEPDGIITCRMRRITNGGTNNTYAIFLLTSDIHYQTTNEATYNRAPNFYSE